MKFAAIILAAGRGTRFGSDKTRARLGGKPVWKWSFDAFRQHSRIEQVVIVASESNREAIEREVGSDAIVVLGGDSRASSVKQGLLDTEAEFVLIHDGARPFVDAELIDRVAEATIAHSAAAPWTPVVDTLRAEDRCIVDRSALHAMQTPQGVRREDLMQALDSITEQLTDDVAYLQAIGIDFELVKGDPANFKITDAVDLAMARGVVGWRETRSGLGYDIHRFSEDPSRPLVLGGVLFEGIGLEGHSDADPLLHAVVDALLGAVGFGDIGVHFPNSDPRWKNAPSVHFLKHAAQLLSENGWKVANLDVTVVAERPKVMARSQEIREVIAEAIGCEVGRVSIKATTNERLGAIGREEGVAAFAVAAVVEA